MYITWEDIYNTGGLREGLLTWYCTTKFKLKERSSYYIDRRGRFVIEWDISYKERFSVLKWSDLFDYFEGYLDIKVIKGSIVNVIKLPHCSISVPIKDDSVQNSNYIASILVRYLLDSKATIRELNINSILEKYEN